MTVIPPIPKEYQRLIFGSLAFAGAAFFGVLSTTVPSASVITGDLAKIFAVGFVSALCFYFGARGQT